MAYCPTKVLYVHLHYNFKLFNLMKTITKKILSLALVAFSMVLLFSCSSDDSSSSSGQTTEQGFFYNENGITPLLKADDAWVNGDYNSIIAQNNNATIIEIVLSDLAVGTYDLSLPYAFTYVKSGHWTASAGTLTITKNENNKLSGTFEATAGSGVSGVNSVKGEFNDLPIQ